MEQTTSTSSDGSQWNLVVFIIIKSNVRHTSFSAAAFKASSYMPLNIRLWCGYLTIFSYISIALSNTEEVYIFLALELCFNVSQYTCRIIFINTHGSVNIIKRFNYTIQGVHTFLKSACSINHVYYWRQVLICCNCHFTLPMLRKLKQCACLNEHNGSLIVK